MDVMLGGDSRLPLRYSAMGREPGAEAESDGPLRVLKRFAGGVRSVAATTADPGGGRTGGKEGPAGPGPVPEEPCAPALSLLPFPNSTPHHLKKPLPAEPHH